MAVDSAYGGDGAGLGGGEGAGLQKQQGWHEVGSQTGSGKRPYTLHSRVLNARQTGPYLGGGGEGEGGGGLGDGGGGLGGCSPGGWGGRGDGGGGEGLHKEWRYLG